MNVIEKVAATPFSSWLQRWGMACAARDGIPSLQVNARPPLGATCDIGIIISSLFDLMIIFGPLAKTKLVVTSVPEMHLLILAPLHHATVNLPNDSFGLSTLAKASIIHIISLIVANPFPRSRPISCRKGALLAGMTLHQVHSEEVIFQWNYQAVKTTMKKLRHCIKLQVVGPIDVEGVAKSYVDACVQHGLNYQRTRYIVQALISIGADLLATKGGATAVTVADYIDSVVSNTLDCLTDAGKIQSYLSDYLSEKFEATVREESHWIYWDL